VTAFAWGLWLMWVPLALRFSVEQGLWQTQQSDEPNQASWSGHRDGSHLFCGQFWNHHRVEVKVKDNGGGRSPKQIWLKNAVFTFKFLLKFMYIDSKFSEEWRRASSCQLAFPPTSKTVARTLFSFFNHCCFFVLLDFLRDSNFLLQLLRHYQLTTHSPSNTA
jgi:hypothetical protein